MPLPRFLGCILRKAADKLSWAPNAKWSQMTRRQQGEMTKAQVRAMLEKLRHKPVRFEHPEFGKVKVGEIATTYLDDNDAWKVVFEINDGDHAGAAVLKLVRDGVIRGLSLSHDTEQLEPIEVSLCEEGFRYDTGVECELGPQPLTDAKNGVEYILDASSPTAISGQPSVMSASTAAASSSASAPFGSGGAASSSLPLSPPPQSVPQQGHPPPPQQQQQPQQQATTPPAKSVADTTTTMEDMSPQEVVQLLESIVSNQYVPIELRRKLMGHNKAQQKKLQEKEAQLRIAQQSAQDVSKLYDETVRVLVKKLTPPAHRTVSDEDERKMMADNPAAFKAYHLPKLMEASARLGGVGANETTLLDSDGTQPQQQQYIQHPIDLQLQEDMNSFRDILFQNSSSSSSSYYQPPPPPPPPQQQQQHYYDNHHHVPRVMQASANHKRQRYEETAAEPPAGPRCAANWYLRTPGITPATANIFRETQHASSVGFGDSMRLSDVRTSNAVKQRAPSADEVAHLEPRY